MKVNIVCPSHLRAKSVLTTNLIPTLRLVVRGSEVDEYKEHNPDNEVIGTPPEVNNIAKTRQWMLDNLMEDNIFMVDDDVTSVRRTYVESGEDDNITDPEIISEIISQHAYISNEIGSKTWGYKSIRDPRQYRSMRPIIHRFYLNNSHIGFHKGHGLTYAEDFGEAEDYYITCMDMYQNRYSFIDTRFSFMTKDNFLADGGVNDLRTVDMMKKNTIRLRKLFGEVVKIKSPTTIKKKVHEGERTISFTDG